MPHKKKRTYKHKREAIAACLRASKRTGRGFRVYPCKECHGWHMTGEKR